MYKRQGPVGAGGRDGIGGAFPAIDVVVAGHGTVGLDAVAADALVRALCGNDHAEIVGLVLPANQE